MKRILIIPYKIDNSLIELAYLSEGILEELIFLFSATQDVSTTPRSTSLYLQNNPIPLKDIKERFNADFLLEGNVKLIDNNYKISTQVFNTTTKELVFNNRSSFKPDKWTQNLENLVNDILLAIKSEKTHLANVVKDTSRAREYYQQGLYHWNRYSHQEMLLAIGYFKKSIKQNESFALPYAAMADCYSIIGIMGYEQPVKAFKLAKKHVGKALVLNNKRSDSYVSAALVNIFYDRDYPLAKANLAQALKLSNKNLKAHHAWAMYYIHKRDLKNAEEHSAITIKLDPLALPHYAMMIRIQMYQKNYQLALDYLNAALHIDAQSLALLELRGFINLFLGYTDLAIEDFKTCTSGMGNNPMSFAYLGYAYSKANFHNESKETEQQVLDMGIKMDTGIAAYALAIIKLGQSDYKGFFTNAQKAVSLVVGMCSGELLCNPIFIEVRKDNRFQKLLAQCNLLDEDTTRTTKRKPSSRITLSTKTAETITFDPQDILYIEADDVYTTVYWYDSGVLKNEILRATLKSVENQLSNIDYIVRCHKSFIINLHQDITITGGARTSFFEGNYLPVRVPISRAKVKMLEDLLNT